MTIPLQAPPEAERAPSVPGFGWRVGVSVATVFGLLSFVLLYFGFWAHLFTGFQTAVVLLVSVLVFIGINGATWAGWGARTYAKVGL